MKINWNAVSNYWLSCLFTLLAVVVFMAWFISLVMLVEGMFKGKIKILMSIIHIIIIIIIIFAITVYVGTTR